MEEEPVSEVAVAAPAALQLSLETLPAPQQLEPEVLEGYLR